MKEWQKDEYASDLYGRKIVFICEGKAYLLTSEDGKSTTASEISSLESTQEETDTRVILYIDYAQRNEYKYARVKSPDSDIFLFFYTMQTTSKILPFFLIQVLETKRD